MSASITWIWNESLPLFSLSNQLHTESWKALPGNSLEELFGCLFSNRSFQWFNGSKDMANMVVEVMVTDLRHSQAYQLVVSRFQPPPHRHTGTPLPCRLPSSTALSAAASSPKPIQKQGPQSKYRKMDLIKLEIVNAMFWSHEKIEFHDCMSPVIRSEGPWLFLHWAGLHLIWPVYKALSHFLKESSFVRILRKRCKMQCVFRMQSR